MQRCLNTMVVCGSLLLGGPPFLLLGRSFQSEPFKIVDNVDLVVLDASVRNRQGEFLTHLDKSSFRIFVDGKPQNLTQFSRVDAPVTIGLIVDNSGSMRTKRKDVVMAGLAFAKESNPQDEFFVVNFNNSVSPGLPATMAFTDNINDLHSALYMGASQGQTALYDAVAFGLKHLEEGHHEKRTLIVVSDGGDNVSKLHQSDILNLIEQSRATVFSIGLLDPDDRDLQPAILKKLAAISGGEYFEPKRTEDISQVLNSISREIRARYTLGFSPVLRDSSGGTHEIKVSATLDGKKLLVRTRTSYSTTNARP